MGEDVPDGFYTAVIIGGLGFLLLFLLLLLAWVMYEADQDYKRQQELKRFKDGLDYKQRRKEQSP